MVAIARDSTEARELIRAMGQAEFHSRQRTGNTGFYAATLTVLADRLDQVLKGNALDAWAIVMPPGAYLPPPAPVRRSQALSPGTIPIAQLAAGNDIRDASTYQAFTS